MVYRYYPPASKSPYLQFFIRVFLLSLVLNFLGRFITEAVIIFIFILVDPSEASFLSEYINNVFTLEYLLDFFIMPFVIALILSVLAGAIAFIVNLASIGSKITSGLYIRFAKSRFGSLLSRAGIFDFTGVWICEQKISQDIDLRTGKSMFKELIGKRKVDVLFFPAILVTFILVIITKVTGFSDETEQALEIIAALIIFFTILVLCFYIPSMWIIQDAEIKKVDIGKTGDINNVVHIASSYRSGVTLIFGFSALVGFGDIAVKAFVNLAKNTLQRQDVSINTLASYVVTYLYAIGFLLMMASWVLPGVALAMIRYMNNHGKNIAQMRENVVKKGICQDGTLSQEFSGSSESKTTYEIITE